MAQGREAIFALAVILTAVAVVALMFVTNQCVEYATVRVPARVVLRAQRATTVDPAHDEIVCVKR